MKLSDFDFNLPKNLIAQKPASPRDACRLMILDRKEKTIEHDRFYNLDKYLEKGDVLVLNNSKVLPARLIGEKITGGKAEILLLKQLTPDSWECLVGFVPIKKQLNLKINFKNNLTGEIIKRLENTAIIKFNLSGGKLMEKILKIGLTPTPPYIKAQTKNSILKKEYQTIYAKELGSVAAPTAGLHFTKKVFGKLKKKGVEIEYITLHVGLGTFQPVKTDDIEKHQMHAEYFHLDKKTSERLNKAKQQGRRIIAVGTTTVRVLESCTRFPPLPKAVYPLSEESVDSPPAREGVRGGGSNLMPQTGSTAIFIYPGYKFKFVDAMITNFHVPKSTLIMLVSAFAGKKFINQAYQTAIKKKYRFYSFGDGMLIE